MRSAYSTVFLELFTDRVHLGGFASLEDSDLSHVTSVGEVVIARAHVTVLPRLRDAEARRVAGGWSVVQLILQIGTGVTSLVKVKIQLFYIKLSNMVNHFKRQAGTSRWLESVASFLHPTHIGAIRTCFEKRCQCRLRHPYEYYRKVFESDLTDSNVCRSVCRE